MRIIFRVLFLELKKWLSCDVTDAGSVGTFGLTRYPYYFNTYPVEKKTRTDSTSTSAGHCHRLILNKVGTPPDGTDVDDPRRNCVSVYESESREKLDNISKTDSGYGHSTQSSYAL